MTSSLYCFARMKLGTRNRRVGETAMNRESSRSHSVFTVIIEAEEIKEGITIKKYSRFNLIDLAGSERQKSTHTTGEQLKEASSINRSLSALGNVIMSLVEQAAGKTRSTFVCNDKNIT